MNKNNNTNITDKAVLRMGGLFQTKLNEKQQKNTELNLLEFKQRKTELKSLRNMAKYHHLKVSRVRLIKS